MTTHRPIDSGHDIPRTLGEHPPASNESHTLNSEPAQGGESLPEHAVTPEQQASFVEGLTNDLNAQDTELIETKEQSLIEAVGGAREAQRSDIWNAVKESNRMHASTNVGILLREIDKPAADAEKDAFDRIVDSVQADIAPKGYKSPDVALIHIGANLADVALIEASNNDPLIREKAEQTIRLLAEFGSYKLFQWGYASQLEVVANLLAEYMKQVPDFDPKKAGVDQLHTTLITSIAALCVDNTTKPNYPYAHPERGSLRAGLLDSLWQLQDGLAHHSFFKYYKNQTNAMSETAEQKALEAIPSEQSHDYQAAAAVGVTAAEEVVDVPDAGTPSPIEAEHTSPEAEVRTLVEMMKAMSVRLAENKWIDPDEVFEIVNRFWAVHNAADAKTLENKSLVSAEELRQIAPLSKAWQDLSKIRKAGNMTHKEYNAEYASGEELRATIFGYVERDDSSLPYIDRMFMVIKHSTPGKAVWRAATTGLDSTGSKAFVDKYMEHFVKQLDAAYKAGKLSARDSDDAMNALILA